MKTMRASRDHDDMVCDRAIISVAKGNTEALSVIYRTYGRMIVSVAYQIVKNQQDAQDVLQDVLLCIAKKAAKYKPSTNPRAWVMTITRNLALNAVKANRTHASFEELTDCDLVRTAHNFAEEHVILDDALRTLSDEERLIVKLKTYIGLSHAEIASVLEITESNAQKRYERAIAKLRTYFEE